MSRVGKKPIILESGVKVETTGEVVKVRGPKGSLDLSAPSGIKVVISEGEVKVNAADLCPKSIHGLFRSLLQNAVLGVTKGWQKTLELVGVGYRAEVSGSELILNLGFAHPVKFSAPQNITFSVSENKITVSGIDKYLVGEMAAKIRNIKKPEPYKGKGIRYVGEYIRKKLGKAAKAVGVTQSK